MFSPRTPGTGSKAKPSPFRQQRIGRISRSRHATPLRSARNESSMANQSFHSSHVFVEETSHHHIEAFGAPLPVLITEALTLSDRNTTEITASIDPSGWAWLVGGRKLFVWRYKPAKTSVGSRVHEDSRVDEDLSLLMSTSTLEYLQETEGAVQCKELTLPPSDLAHSAERVCLIPSEHQGQPAACVAVSPEGVVRYWPNIAFESSTAEISAELKGEECAQVIYFQPHGCLLATTTSSLLLLQPVQGQASITCKPLKSSQGLFSGISRRMSSFMFGASQVQMNGTPLQAIVASPENEYDDEEDGEDRRSFYVLSGNHISKWQIPNIGTEKLLYQMDADRLFRESLAKSVWGQDSVQLPQLKTWLLDLQLTRDGIVMLGAGVNLEAAHVIYFALAYMETYEDAQPSNISDLVMLDYTQNYSDENEDQMASYKLLAPSEKSACKFIYNGSSILMLQEDSSLDKMDLKTPRDLILGAGVADGTAVFFSNTHGLFSVSTTKQEQSILEESKNEGAVPRVDLCSLVGNMSNLAEAADSDDNATNLKAAFIASISGDQEQAQNLVDNICLLNRTDAGRSGSELDQIVAAVSRDLINDYPNADPRWAESSKHESNSSTASVIILQQLRDKEKAHDFFVAFLKKYGLWSQMSVVSVRDSVMPTRLLLCEHVEKLEAAIALRELHADYHKMVNTCIRKAVDQRNVVIPSSLTAQDMFYREVSNIHELAQLILEFEIEELSRDQTSMNVVTLVLAVNAIIEAMLHHALKYRQSHADMYTGGNEDIPEYIPWTATTAMRATISKQISMSLERGVKEAREVDVQGVIYQNIVGLADIVMDGYASQVKSLQCQPERELDCSQLEQKFEQERHNLILPLLDHKQYDRAASLAEKYEDFEMLMRICDVTNNQDRLQRYRSQYADKGFAQFLFSWYMKEGKRGHLLTQPVSQGDELSEFLHSDNVKYLSWLHEIGRGNFLAAHTVLSDLASEEKNFLWKKKTLLSLSKLAALASDTDDDVQDNIDAINEELDLVLHQEQLSTETLQNIGMDQSNMRVLSPEELIELYVSEKNEFANELDVKKALDLLRYVDKSQNDSDYETLKLHIWCRAILMDSWNETNHTDPLEGNREKVFLKTVDLVYMEGELENLLPDLNTLLSAEELAGLSKQANFLFLMRGCYEQINSTLNAMK